MFVRIDLLYVKLRYYWRGFSCMTFYTFQKEQCIHTQPHRPTATHTKKKPIYFKTKKQSAYIYISLIPNYIINMLALKLRSLTLNTVHNFGCVVPFVGTLACDGGSICGIWKLIKNLLGLQIILEKKELICDPLLLFFITVCFNNDTGCVVLAWPWIILTQRDTVDLCQVFCNIIIIIIADCCFVAELFMKSDMISVNTTSIVESKTVNDRPCTV